MRSFGVGVVVFVLGGAMAAACSSSGNQSSEGSGGGATQAGPGGSGPSGSGGRSSSHGPGSGGGSNTGASGPGGSGQGGGQGTGGGGGCVDTMDANRDRLLTSYFHYLKANVTTPQSNGLSGNNVNDVCDVWTKLDPSSQATFLTITARLQSSKLGIDDSSMLCHVTKVYRVTGGEGATDTDPGSCGGGEFNRMIMSMDDELHTAQIAANTNQGAMGPNGKYDIADAPPGGTFWRDSHDLGGSHAPFDISDETDTGAPRGQTQYFQDPTSTLANSPLGRQDLMSLVDPYALEMDQDYNCPHDSNPLCSYTTYGQFCFPESAELGTQLYADSYGDYEPNWKPSGCN